MMQSARQTKYLRGYSNAYPHRLRSQQGVVIVVALFMMALVAGIAYYMMARIDRDINRTRLITENTQAQFYAQGSVIWAIDQLRNNWIKQKNDHVIDPLPIKSPENVINGYHIKSIIYDAQDKMNVNNLITPEAQVDFLLFLKNAVPTIKEEDANKLTSAIADWILPGDSNENNSLNAYYLHATPPHRSAHRLIVHMSELTLLKGFTPKIIASLSPFVFALPMTTPINVQTAPWQVIASLSPTMNAASAKALVKMREQKPFTSLSDFLNNDVVKNHSIPAEKVTTVSSYFLVETSVTIDELSYNLYTLLERNARDGQASVRMIWQSK